MRSGWCVLLIVLVGMVSTGCVRVRPWERYRLSKASMTFDAEVDENVLDHSYYNAREGAAGGFEEGGGGCGCN